MDALHTKAFDLIRRDALSLGEVQPFGSVKKSKAFSNAHDFDVGILTDYTSTQFILDKLRPIMGSWPYELPLHVMVVGDFAPHFYRIDGDLVQFIPRNMRKVNQLWQKFQKVNPFRSRK